MAISYALAHHGGDLAGHGVHDVGVDAQSAAAGECLARQLQQEALPAAVNGFVCVRAVGTVIH